MRDKNRDGCDKTKAGAAISFNLRAGFSDLSPSQKKNYRGTRITRKFLLHYTDDVAFHATSTLKELDLRSRLRENVHSKGKKERGESFPQMSAAVTWSSWGISSFWIPLHHKVHSIEEAQSCLSTLMRHLHKPILPTY